MDLSIDWCPVCRILYLTRPQVSVGHHTAANEGRVYQKCPLNTFDDFSGCKGFVWRDDLSPPPWGPMASSMSSSTSTTPTTTPSRAAVTHCVSLVCTASAKPFSCRISSHNNRPTIPKITFPFAANQQALAPPAFAGPYATMIPQEYAHKIMQGDFGVTPSNRLQTEAYRLESQTMIKVKYWVEDTLPAITFSVPVNHFPWFHPKTCTTITTRLQSIHLSCENYEVLDTVLNPLETTAEADDEWIMMGSATKVKANMTLYLRCPGVTLCPGLRPTTPRKRVLSQSGLSSPSSSYRIPDTPTPAKRSRLVTPPSSPSNTNGTWNSSPFSMVASSSSATPPPSSVSTPFTPKQVAASSDSSSILNSHSSGSTISLNTPLGKLAPFPLAFASDMDAAFRRIDGLPKDWHAKEHFDNVLGHLGFTFVPSTYSDNLNAWKNASLKETIMRAVACGHNSGGEWAPILKEHRRLKAGKTSF
ncbi:hypothetical protein C8F04DRAFT_1257076 [Mycena alexandri]|uniref:Zinc finger GRF-type domain-containing protein n=1 Tax=Mycena alexandri TaxID=1745969 RepID=A0AAD6T0J2_9AGAR|nr:hypothetical protein C8F04DRAFT_1257076 [Mycena alexandri]